MRCNESGEVEGKPIQHPMMPRSKLCALTGLTINTHHSVNYKQYLTEQFLLSQWDTIQRNNKTYMSMEGSNTKKFW